MHPVIPPGLHDFPHDPNQWALFLTEVPGAWVIERGRPELVVALVDTGCHVDHPDLRRRIWTNPRLGPGRGAAEGADGIRDDVHGWDFVGNDNTVGLPAPGHDNAYHGTTCAAIVAGDGGPDGTGIWGVAPGCTVLPVRAEVYDDGQVARAIRYAVDRGARVITMNAGYHPAILQRVYRPPAPGVARRGDWAAPTTQELRGACAYAWRHGCVLLCGVNDNDGRESLKYPSALDTVVSVGGCDRSGQRADFSSYAGYVEVAAPAGNKRPGLPETEQRWKTSSREDPYGYGYASGQSAAAPHAAGVVALILSRHPEFTNEQARQILRNTATGPRDGRGWNNEVGHGVVNARRAVALDTAETRLAIGPEDLAIRRLPSGGVELAAVVHNLGVMDAPSVHVLYYSAPPEDAKPQGAGAGLYLEG